MPVSRDVVRIFITRGAVVALGLFAVVVATAVSPFLQVQQDQSTSTSLSNQTIATITLQRKSPTTGAIGSVSASNCNEAIENIPWVRACIKATSAASQPIEIKIGSSASISVQFHHQAGASPLTDGVSIILGITEPRPGEFLVEGSLAGGNVSESVSSLPFARYAAFIPTKLTLRPGETADVTMIITIPSYFPSALIGRKLGIPITWGLSEVPDSIQESGVWKTYGEVAVVVR
jgi:hypothetical protein